MIRPLPGYVLIEPIEDETVTTGGVYLPDSSKDKPSRGKVVNIGSITKDWNDQWYVPEGIESWFDIGSVVIYKKWTNQEVKDGDKTYLLVPFSELMAVVE